jgi:predicted nicotinamide N-methyase
VPLVPEIRLRLAAEPISLWESTERALGQAGLPPPYWGFAWAGGQALARYLLDRPAAVRGRPVIDLASGSGLVAIAAAKAGAAQVTAYDVDPLAIAAITANAAANRVAVTAVRADILDGSLPGPATARQQSPADGRAVLLVADACYERELAARMLGFLARARAAGADVLLADPGRAYLPRTGLTALTSYQVPGVAALEDSDRKLTTIWVPA